MTDTERLTWADSVIERCLREADGDVVAALEAADYILSTEPIPNEELPLTNINAFFAHDIYNRKAQGILNRSLQAIKKLSAAAKKDLAVALKENTQDSGEAILAFINKYRLQLAKLLTTTQLGSLLEVLARSLSRCHHSAQYPSRDYQL